MWLEFADLLVFGTLFADDIVLVNLRPAVSVLRQQVNFYAFVSFVILYFREDAAAIPRSATRLDQRVARQCGTQFV